MSGAERWVLDSFALLAYLEDEPGGGSVLEILASCERSQAEAWMSIVNLGEVLYITEREQGPRRAQAAIAAIDQLPFRVLNADRDRTFAAAHVKASNPVSYADAFAIALARELGATVVTGDPEFRKIEHLAPVLWIG